MFVKRNSYLGLFPDDPKRKYTLSVARQINLHMDHVECLDDGSVLQCIFIILSDCEYCGRKVYFSLQMHEEE